MKTGKRHLPSPFTYASPWILAAAIGILIAIVFFFAANNLRREKRIMTENLFNKGQSIVRFIGAGSRATWMMGAPSPRQIQPLIEQASVDSDILYIAITGPDGTILAHSKADRVGTLLDHPALTSREQAGPPISRYRIIDGVGGEKPVFEVIAPFKPFMRGRGYFPRKQMMERGEIPCPEPENPNSPALCSPPPESWGWAGRSNLTILVGLDMSEQNQIIQQSRYQILSISVALLLVAIGGWTALLTAQSYRSSQKTIKDMQAFTDLLISRLPVGIIATGKKGLIQTCNGAAARLTGTTAEEVLGRTPSAVLPEALRMLFPQGDEITALIDSTLFLKTDSDETLHLRVSSMPIGEQSEENPGRVALLDDISEINRLESRIRRQDRLVALGKMAAGVAHELRNPLSSIKGFALLLGSRFSENSEEKQAAELLVNEVERLNRGITELLSYARPQPPSISEFALGPFIAESLRLIESDAAALGVKLDWEIASTHELVALDRDRLKQVLLNLYLNSLQAMEGGGRLSVTVADGEQANSLTIRVHDTGCGIREDLLERVFDPYFTTKPGGTGLGLAMVQKLIDEHGGSVRITSKEGEGTTVSITLPV